MKKTMAICTALVLMIVQIIIGGDLEAYAVQSGTLDGVTYALYDEGAVVIGFENSGFSMLVNTKVTIPDSISNEYNTYPVIGIGTISDSAFASTSVLSGGIFSGIFLNEVVMPNNLLWIGDSAFAMAQGLSKVTIPNSVIKIGSGAFYCCTTLKSITIPKKVSMVGSNSFSACSSLKDVYFESVNCSIADTAFDNSPSVSFHGYKNSTAYNYAIAKGISFHCLDTGETINPKPKQTTVQSTTQANSTSPSIQSGKCGDNLTWTFDSSGMLTISGHGKMENYDFGFSNETTAPWNSFSAKIKKVSIMDEVKSIGDSAFRNCKNLISVTAPEGLVSIGEGAFAYCDNLTNFPIPNSVTNIGAAAFISCKKITKVSIPSSVKSIESATFLNCEKLTTVTISSTVTNIVSDAILDCNSMLTIYGEAGSCAEKYAKENNIIFKVIESSQGTFTTTIRQTTSTSTNRSTYTTTTVRQTSSTTATTQRMTSTTTTTVRQTSLTTATTRRTTIATTTTVNYKAEVELSIIPDVVYFGESAVVHIALTKNPGVNSAEFGLRINSSTYNIVKPSNGSSLNLKYDDYKGTLWFTLDSGMNTNAGDNLLDIQIPYESIGTGNWYPVDYVSKYDGKTDFWANIDNKGEKRCFDNITIVKELFEIQANKPIVHVSSIKPGDINQDGMLDIMDVIQMNRYLLGLINFTSEQCEIADVNNNNLVDPADALDILKMVLSG